MIRRLALLLMVVALLSFTGQGAATAAPERIKAPSIGMNAPVVKVGVGNGRLLVGNNLHAVYTWRLGDPPCDDTGTTVFAGHAWRAGNGVADKWGNLRSGALVHIAGCTFKVTKREFWPANRSIRHLFTVAGPAKAVMIGCKPTDYSKRTMVFLKKVDADKVANRSTMNTTMRHGSPRFI